MSLSPEQLPELCIWDNGPSTPRKSGLVTKPDYRAFEAAVKGIDSQITGLEQELAQTKAKIKEKRQSEGTYDWDLSLNPVFLKRKSLEDRKDQLLSQHNELTTKCTQIITKQAQIRQKITPNDSQSIAKYEEINAEFEGNRALRRQISEQLTDLYRELEEMNQQETPIPSLKASLDIDALLTHSNSLKTNLETLKNKKKRLVAEHKEQENTYKDQQKQLKHLEHTLNTQKKMKEMEEKRRLREEEASKYEKEVTLCDGIIRYLERMMVLPGKIPLEEEEKPQIVTEVEAGLELVVDKKLREAQEGLNWFRNVQTKAKKKRERKGGLDSPIVQLPVEMMGFLAAKGLKIPANMSEIEGVIQALTQWKSQEARKSPRKPETCEDSASVKSEDFPSVRGFESPRLNPEDPPKPKPHSSRRGGKRGRGGRYKESRKGSEPLFSGTHSPYISSDK